MQEGGVRGDLASAVSQNQGELAKLLEQERNEKCAKRGELGGGKHADYMLSLQRIRSSEVDASRWRGRLR